MKVRRKEKTDAKKKISTGVEPKIGTRFCAGLFGIGQYRKGCMNEQFLKNTT